MGADRSEKAHLSTWSQWHETWVPIDGSGLALIGWVHIGCLTPHVLGMDGTWLHGGFPGSECEICKAKITHPLVEASPLYGPTTWAEWHAVQVAVQADDFSSSEAQT